jgi:hypothetical protein
VRKRWVILIALGAFFLGVGVGVGTSSSKTTPGAPVPAPPGAAVPAATAPAAGAPASEFSPIGSSVQLSNHAVAVLSFKRNWSSGNEFLKPAEGNEYVVVQVAFRNTGDSPLPINLFGFQLEDENGVMRTASLMAGVSGMLESVSIQPGGRISGNVAFEALRGSNKLVVHYSGGLLSKGCRWRLQ